MGLQLLDRLGLPRNILIGVGVWFILSGALSSLPPAVTAAAAIIQLLAIGLTIVWARRQPGRASAHSLWHEWSSGRMGLFVVRRDVVVCAVIWSVAQAIDPYWKYAYPTALVIILISTWRRGRRWRSSQRTNGASP